MNITQITPPAALPISLDEAKHFLRVIEDDDNDLITLMIKSATEHVENYTNRQLMEATFELVNNCIYQDMQINKTPIKTIDKIEAMDENGAYQLVAPTDYYMFMDYGQARIHFETFPQYKNDLRAIKITFICGYDTVPTAIIAYLKVLISTMYENRELYTAVGGRRDNFENPLAQKMLDMYRVRPI